MITSTPTINKIVAEELNDYIQIQETLKENVLRLQRVIRVQLILQKELAERLQADELVAYLEDIHRTVVVLAHSMLETTLTELIRRRLKARFNLSSEQIPFVGSKSEKLSLKDLWKHRGKTVDELINQSIDEHMNRKSFNQIEDITKSLEDIGVQASIMNKYLGTLSQMIQRRHRIVHESDYEMNGLQKGLAKIKFDEVSKWASTVREFCSDAMKEVILSKSLVEDLQKKAQTQGVIASIAEIEQVIKSMLNLSRAI